MMSTTRQSKGFTLIELVVVIAILAILAAFALPRFAQLSEQAHESSIQGTSGSLAAGVALSRAQWVSNGFTTATTDLEGFGNETVNMSDGGWPVSAGTQTNNVPGSISDADCVSLWNGLLQANAPDVAAASADGIDYVAGASGSTCTYTYQPDGQGSTITYDAANGEVETTINSTP